MPKPFKYIPKLFVPQFNEASDFEAGCDIKVVGDVTGDVRDSLVVLNLSEPVGVDIAAGPNSEDPPLESDPQVQSGEGEGRPVVVPVGVGIAVGANSEDPTSEFDPLVQSGEKDGWPLLVMRWWVSAQRMLLSSAEAFNAVANALKAAFYFTQATSALVRSLYQWVQGGQ